jgi:hypothetical protein
LKVDNDDRDHLEDGADASEHGVHSGCRGGSYSQLPVTAIAEMKAHPMSGKEPSDRTAAVAGRVRRLK